MPLKTFVHILSMAVCLCACATTDNPIPSQAPAMSTTLAGAAKLHGKYFGTAVVHGALFSQEYPELSSRYRDLAASQFNLVVPESELKMSNVWIAERQIDLRKFDSIANWAIRHGMKMRAHTLVWYRSVPVWLIDGYRAGDYTDDTIAALTRWYITAVMTHCKSAFPGLVIAWDVVNEAIGPNDPTTSIAFGLRPKGLDALTAGEDFWRLTLGDNYPEKAFAWARAADSDAKLFYNDYHDEYSNPKGESIYRFVTAMLRQGVPIDGIGLQCHFSTSYLDRSFPGITFSVAGISQTVQRWIATGLDVHVTEADIGIDSAQDTRQAKLYAELLGATLLNSGVSAFVTWGFTDRVSWREGKTPLYFDQTLMPKPAYDSMLNVLNNWK